MKKNSDKKVPQIIAIGGGKGGAGKSMVAAGLSTSLAGMGHTTYCIDLDLGGSNLHTLLGIKRVTKGIGDFIYEKGARQLSDYAVNCNIKNLKLIAGAGFIPGIANLYYFQKTKVIRGIKRLNADYAILDLGAGSSYNVVDFFSITGNGIVVINPEPTSVLNGYEFLKNVLYRMFSRAFKKGSHAQDIIEIHKVGADGKRGSTVRRLLDEIHRYDPGAAEKIVQICQDFSPAVILNMMDNATQAEKLFDNLQEISRRYLDIKLKFLGRIPRDSSVESAVIKMENLAAMRPDSPVSQALQTIARRCASTDFSAQIKIHGDETKQGLEQEDSGYTNGPSENNERPQMSHPQAQEKSTGNGDNNISWLPTDNDAESDEISTLLGIFLHQISHNNGAGLEKRDNRAAQTATHTEMKPDGDGVLCHYIPPIDFISLQPRSEAIWFRPIFFLERVCNSRKIQIPEDPADALSLVVAISDREDALRRDKRTVPDWIGRAWIDCASLFIKAGQMDSAERALKRALALKPDQLEAVANLASLQILKGTLWEAFRLMQPFYEVEMADPVIVFNMGLCRLLNGEYKAAAQAFTRLVSHPEGMPFLFPLLSLSMFHAERFDDALQALELWENADEIRNKWEQPDADLVIGFNKALVFMRLNDLSQAASILKQILKRSPQDFEIHSALAACFLSMDDIEKAEYHLNKAISLRPSDVALRAARASLLYGRKMLDRAIEDAEVIARLRPGNPGFSQLIQAIKEAI